MQVVDRLLPLIENNEDGFQAADIQALANFLLHNGQYVELIQFVLKHLDNESFPVPWPYLLEAVAHSRAEIDDDLADNLIEGIDKSDARSDASRSHALDLQMPSLKAERADRKLRAAKEYRREKDNLLEHLVTLRTQQLYEQEKQLLQRLQKMYPRDEDVVKEVLNHKQRYALEILAKHSRITSSTTFDPGPEAEGTEALREACSKMLIHFGETHPEFAKDFAVAAAMLELWDAALALIPEPSLTAPHGADWMRLEILLGARRYLDLLHALGSIEQEHAREPETFFATAYLRAQALWGLGQKHQAIEVLESLLAARPQYRSGASLLNLWRSQ